MFVFKSFSVTVLFRCNCCKFNHLKIVYYTLFFSAKQWECRGKKLTLVCLDLQVNQNA